MYKLHKLPIELIRSLMIDINHSLIYYNLIQTNTLFLDILSAQDLINIKNSYKVKVHKINDNICSEQDFWTNFSREADEQYIYYILPNEFKHGICIAWFYNEIIVSKYDNNQKLTVNFYNKGAKHFSHEYKYLDDGYIVIGRNINNQIECSTRYFTMPPCGDISHKNIHKNIHKTYCTDEKLGTHMIAKVSTKEDYSCISKRFYDNGMLKSVHHHNNVDTRDYTYTKYHINGDIKEEGKCENNIITKIEAINN